MSLHGYLAATQTNQDIFCVTAVVGASNAGCKTSTATRLLKCTVFSQNQSLNRTREKHGNCYNVDRRTDILTLDGEIEEKYDCASPNRTGGIHLCSSLFFPPLTKHSG